MSKKKTFAITRTGGKKEFAYSYSDNQLDDTESTREFKREYNDWQKNKIQWHHNRNNIVIICAIILLLLILFFILFA